MYYYQLLVKKPVVQSTKQRLGIFEDSTVSESFLVVYVCNKISHTDISIDP